MEVIGTVVGIIFACGYVIGIVGVVAIFADWLRSKIKMVAWPHDGTINGHKYVDLGLSVKWATCNIGAERPVDYGNHYAWGQTRTKARYDDSNCETYRKKIDDIVGTSRDVARVRWGGSWRMPTSDEIDELVANCDYEWTRVNGVRGGKFTSKKNGKSIFLPAAGMRHGTLFFDAGVCGSYWSSAPDVLYAEYAYCLDFDSDGHYPEWGDRHGGCSVRSVSE